MIFLKTHPLYHILTYSCERGRILNVASITAFLPGLLMAVYYATKAYVLSFSEELKKERVGESKSSTYPFSIEVPSESWPPPQANLR